MKTCFLSCLVRLHIGGKQIHWIGKNETSTGLIKQLNKILCIEGLLFLNLKQQAIAGRERRMQFCYQMETVDEDFTTQGGHATIAPKTSLYPMIICIVYMYRDFSSVV